MSEATGRKLWELRKGTGPAAGKLISPWLVLASPPGAERDWRTRRKQLSWRDVVAAIDIR